MFRLELSPFLGYRSKVIIGQNSMESAVRVTLEAGAKLILPPTTVDLALQKLWRRESGAHLNAGTDGLLRSKIQS